MTMRITPDRLFFNGRLICIAGSLAFHQERSKSVRLLPPVEIR
jgi:hypothetical protein